MTQHTLCRLPVTTAGDGRRPPEGAAYTPQPRKFRSSETQFRSALGIAAFPAQLRKGGYGSDAATCEIPWRSAGRSHSLHQKRARPLCLRIKRMAASLRAVGGTVSERP